MPLALQAHFSRQGQLAQNWPLVEEELAPELSELLFPLALPTLLVRQACD
jgi:hypothetical protein